MCDDQTTNLCGQVGVRLRRTELCPCLPTLAKVPCVGTWLTFWITTVYLPARLWCLLETLILNPKPCCLAHTMGLWHICAYPIPALQTPACCPPLSRLCANLGLTSTCTQLTQGGLSSPWADNPAPRDVPKISMP